MASFANEVFAGVYTIHFDGNGDETFSFTLTGQ